MKNMAKTIFVTIVSSLLASAAFAEEMAAAATTTAGSSDNGLIAIAAALAIGLAAIGGALAQGKASSAALDGIARNPAAQPKIFTPLIIGLALIESLVIYAFVISFFLQGKF